MSGDPKNRVQQIVAIGYLYRSTQDVQVLDKLVRYVDNPDSSIRNAVARAIGLIFRGKPLGLEYAIKKITRIGTNLSHEVALKAISVAIRGMPDEFFAHKSIHQYIELLLECSNPTLKSMAIETLGSIFIRTNDVRLLRILEKVLEPSTLIGLAMLKALSMVYYKSGNRSALNLLLKLLEINGDCVRRMAIEAMGLIFKNTQDVHVGHIITQMYDGRDHEVFRRTIERIYGEFNSLRIKVIVLGHKIKSKIFDKMPDYVKKHEDLITSGAKFYTFYDVFELHPLGVVFVEYVVWSLDMSPSYKKIRQLYYSGSKLAVIVINISSIDSLNMLKKTLEEYWKNTYRKLPAVVIGLRSGSNKSIISESIKFYLRSVSENLGMRILYFEVEPQVSFMDLCRIFREGLRNILKYYILRIKKQDIYTPKSKIVGVFR